MILDVKRCGGLSWKKKENIQWRPRVVHMCMCVFTCMHAYTIADSLGLVNLILGQEIWVLHREFLSLPVDVSEQEKD